MTNQISEFWINLVNSLKSSGSYIWVPILFVALLAISFIVGFVFRSKWTIFKIVAIVLTVVISAISYAIISKKIQNSDNSNIRGTEGTIPFVVTIIALISYWVIRAIFFIIVTILHSIPKFKIKRSFGKLKLIRRVIFGATNAIVTIPGALLFADILTVSSKADNSFKKITKVGVEVMTTGYGESWSGLLTSVKSIDNLLKNASNSRLLTTKYSSLSAEDKKKVDLLLSDISTLLNDKRVFDVIVPFIKEKAKENNFNESIKDIVDKAQVRINAEAAKDPRYAEYNLPQTTTERKKELLSQFISEEIAELYREAKLAEPDLDDKIKLLQGATQNLNNQTIKSLTETLDKLVSDESIHSKVDIQKTVESLINFLKERELSRIASENNSEGGN
ncbi:hypothetical protein [Mycoplasmopsis edwardii]|uniref:Uncharacterized protein n=1 Tax=Mycoplasmopsis edwardii TaxID=53558 RepID=A0ACD4PHA8_9BACT|nr:hypothetical protein [Mycoplasmopsis edwardii]WBP84037.1 hypothetical protein Me_995_000671 [Mycoplasmopsis edwardii]